MAYKPFKMKGFSPYQKDQLVKTKLHGDGTSRVKPIKDIGGGVKTQLIKNPDKSTVTQRYQDNEFVSSDYNPKKMKVKKPKKLKTTKVPRKLKNVKAPEYNVKVNLDEKTQKIAEARAKNPKKKKNLISKIFTNKNKTSRPKTRRVKNLVTGKTNIIS